jgi:hypothetical protein
MTLAGKDGHSTFNDLRAAIGKPILKLTVFDKLREQLIEPSNVIITMPHTKIWKADMRMHYLDRAHQCLKESDEHLEVAHAINEELRRFYTGKRKPSEEWNGAIL